MSSHHSGRSRDRPRERDERSRRDDRKRDDDRLREDRRRDERREHSDRHERREHSDRHRERGHRDRDYEKPRRRNSRSRSRSPPNRRKKAARDSPEASKMVAMNPQLLERPEITEKDLEGKTEEEQDMMKMMGFGGFDSTKGKAVTGNDVSAVNLLQKRKYRQYMNRKGGFNRPLDFVA